MPKSTESANVGAELMRAGVTQGSLAELLGISQAQVSARMTDRIAWRLPELRAIADHLEIPLSRLTDAPRDVLAQPGTAVAS